MKEVRSPKFGFISEKNSKKWPKNVFQKPKIFGVKNDFFDFSQLLKLALKFGFHRLKVRKKLT